MTNVKMKSNLLKEILENVLFAVSVILTSLLICYISLVMIVRNNGGVIIGDLRFSNNIGKSNYPTIYEKDITISKIYNGKDPINRFDFVSFNYEDETGVGKKSIQKRVIGLPGETVWVTTIDGKYTVLINEVPLDESKYFKGRKYEGLTMAEPITLKDDEYFVLGDNRTDSVDSTLYGPIRRKRILHVGARLFYRNMFVIFTKWLK